MSLLSDADQKQLRTVFADLHNPVKFIVFTREDDCQYCPETGQIASELAGLGDKITLELVDIDEMPEKAAQYRIDKVPATAVVQNGEDEIDYGIRFYGIPSGYEFSSLIEDTMLVSRGESGLTAETIAWAADLTEPVHLQVFVTPTCPYCPRAVILAHQLAMESEFITADMVEAMEFPELSQKYQVQGVPRTVINETIHLEGAAPEPMLLSKLQQAVAVEVNNM